MIAGLRPASLVVDEFWLGVSLTSSLKRLSEVCIHLMNGLICS